MLCVASLLFIAPVVSFLLETSTPKQVIGGSSFLTDEHYNVLMDMLIQERKSRRSLEQYVVQLNQKISSAENDILNTRSEVGILQKTQSQQDLMNMIIVLKNKTEVTDDKYDKLLLENINLKRELDVLKYEANELRSDVNGLKSLKSVVQMQSVQHLDNITNHLEQEIQNTNDKVSILVSDATARKQDFIALVNEASEMKKESVRQNTSLHGTINDFRNFTIGFMDRMQLNMTAEMKEIVLNLSSKITNEQVAVTACGGGTYTSGEKAKFTSVQQHKGFRNLDAFKQSGTFTCEVEGMYVFFASLISLSTDAYCQWYKNSVSQSFVYVSNRPPSYESGSGMLAVQLTVGDTITLKSVSSNISIDPVSCITIFKIQ